METLGIKLESISASAKGEAIAEVLLTRRVLLLLDGVEPLQYGPGLQVGQLKDIGLRSLLRRSAPAFSVQPHGLIVLSSRVAVADIARWEQTSAPVIDIEQLSDKAGVALLRDNGVWGTDRELQSAAHDFGGHPLALALLATFLKETQFGDVRRRDHIVAWVRDDENPRHGHAKRMMESYEKEWLKDQPMLLAILGMVGLFDRPASGDCLLALRRKPVIKGLTDQIDNLTDSLWNRAVARLREVRLIAPPDSSAPSALDTHPLIREWFGERLRATNETAWRTAHGRIYDHLRRTTDEGERPTLSMLAPLYQAIAHGCLAGRYKEALYEIYVKRICRLGRTGELLWYARGQLGTYGSDLAAVSWFFEEPYQMPSGSLQASDRLWVLSEAAACLKAQGRLGEALLAWRTTVSMSEALSEWCNASTAATQLGEAELLAGNVESAIHITTKNFTFADRCGEFHHKMVARGYHAHAMVAAGRSLEAEGFFADAERSQNTQLGGRTKYLDSVGGFFYCDFLLDKRDYASTRQRARHTLPLARQRKWIRDIALDTLVLARAQLGEALTGDGANAQFGEMLAQFDESIEGIRAAGTYDDVPHSVLARARFWRSVAAWTKASRDLDEVEETAEPGPMRLYLCDLALERTRLALAQVEAYAPLSGILEGNNPPSAVVPSAEEIAKLKDEAAKQVKIADEYIQICGYHRRDEELAELQAVLRGEKKFAELPPRV